MLRRAGRRARADKLRDRDISGLAACANNGGGGVASPQSKSGSGIGGNGGPHVLYAPAAGAGSSASSSYRGRAHAMQHQQQQQQQYISDGKVLIKFTWAGGIARNVTLVGSFDGFLHHRMIMSSHHHHQHLHHPHLRSNNASSSATFSTSLRVHPGTHSYKFLVDGAWRTDPASIHPVAASRDGTLHHRLVVEALPNPQKQQKEEGGDALPQTHSSGGSLYSSPQSYGHHHYYNHRGAAMQGRRPVVRSASVSELPSASRPATLLRAQVLGSESGSHSFAALNVSSSGSSTSSSGTRSASSARGTALDRPSSFMASSTSSASIVTSGAASHSEMSASAHQQRVAAAQRRSLLYRVGSGWMRRLSGRHASNAHEDAIIRGGIYADDKENSEMRQIVGTPERVRAGGVMRASARANAIAHQQPVVSAPTKVDEPRNVEEVSKQADNWRQMARHLQDELHDANGARELLQKAISHREKHGLWCTAENAQVHVDLARNFSKADDMSQAEFQLRVALSIYKKVDAGPEHIGDLLHYIGVVVDRQRKRAEAEELYRQALATYKKYRIAGNNVEIALKNLALNLRKQNRAHEVQPFLESYYDAFDDVRMGAVL